MKQIHLLLLVLVAFKCQTENRREPVSETTKVQASQVEDNSWQSLSQAEISDLAISQQSEDPKLAYKMAIYAAKLNPKSAHGKAAGKLAREIELRAPETAKKIEKFLKASKTKYRDILTSLQLNNFRDWLLDVRPYCIKDEQKCLATIDGLLVQIEKIRGELFGDIQVVSCTPLGQFRGVEVRIDISKLASTKKQIDAMELFFFFQISNDDPKFVIKRYGPFQGLNVKEDEWLDESNSMPIPESINNHITLVFNSTPFDAETCGARVSYSHFTNGAEWRYR